MMLVLALILVPLAVGIALLFLRSHAPRQVLVGAATLFAAGASVGLAFMPTPLSIVLEAAWVSWAMLAIELAMGLYILYVAFRAGSGLLAAMVVAQTAAVLWVEFGSGTHETAVSTLYIDKLAVLMAVINGVVGGGICVYALGYMRDYHESAHKDVADRRPLFFALLFIFMGAMFGLVFANQLLWLFFFWEITTLCSFLLIGYTQTEEARRNALRALVMNTAGGVAFALALVCLRTRGGVMGLQELIATKAGVVLLPAALLCFAGITKSAQMPFSSWLLGAMVAPTPVSALLHSSTMVKAGVYLVLRMAFVITGTPVGLLVALVGAITFLIGSLAAITTQDAKRVLAYSTVANLGLIVLCGGIGTYAAVWAGVLLIMFHAVAKCLLFLCVGVVEHHVHSRDIEAMSGLVKRMPHVAVMMLIGMAGMFLAPFGMLISKWAVLKAVVDAYAPLSVFIAFGSAATLFFWVKWMGKLLEVLGPNETPGRISAAGEAIALYGLSAATFLTCLFFPLISSVLIEPYVQQVYGQSASLGQGNVIIMTIMMLMVMLFPLSFLNYGRGVRVTDAYLGGANVQSSVRFLGSANQVQQVAMGNYYLRGLLSEAWLSRCGVVASGAFLAVMLVTALV